MIELKLDAKFQGPTLSELVPIFDMLPDPVIARWDGADLELVQACERLVLVVADVDTQARVALLLGRRVVWDDETLEACRKTLTASRDMAWKPWIESRGAQLGSAALLAVLGHSVRSGRYPVAALSVVSDVVHKKTHPGDADVFLRLRAGKC